MKVLSYSVITSSGRAYDIEFPLHAHTRSESGVSQIVTELLEQLSDILASDNSVSDGDVLQSLAMLLAVRARMLDDKPDTIARLSHDLLQTALQAAFAADGYSASRA